MLMEPIVEITEDEVAQVFLFPETPDFPHK